MHPYPSAPVSVLGYGSGYTRTETRGRRRHHELGYPLGIRAHRNARAQLNAQISAHHSAHAHGMAPRLPNSPYNQLFRKFRITTYRRRGRAPAGKLGAVASWHKKTRTGGGTGGLLGVVRAGYQIAIK